METHKTKRLLNISFLTSFCFVLLTIIFACNRKESTKIVDESMINDKILINTIQEVYNRDNYKNDSTGFVNVSISIINDSLIYDFGYHSRICIFLNTSPPSFIFRVGNIPVTVTSHFINQFRVTDSTLMNFYNSNSRFKREFREFLKYKITPPPDIDDSEYPRLVYYDGKFIRKYYSL